MFVDAIKEKKIWPKIITIVLDYDFVKFLACRNGDNSFVMGRLLYWLMSEFQKIISGYNDQMPSKAKKANYPHMIWIKAPLHNCFRPQTNNLRGKFNACLDKMGKLQLNTSVLELKKIWNPEDSALVLPGTDILTAKGCTTYWEAVDRTIKYCDTTTLRKEAAKEFKEIKNPKMGYQHHFHYCQKTLPI